MVPICAANGYVAAGSSIGKARSGRFPPRQRRFQPRSTGAAKNKTPNVGAIGVLPFLPSDQACRNLGKPQVPVRACAGSIFFTSTRSAQRTANQNCLPEPAGWRVHDGSQVDCRMLTHPERRTGELEGMESRADRGTDRRSPVHRPVTALEPVRALVVCFVPLRRACVIHGDLTSGSD